MRVVAEIAMGPMAQATGWALVHFVWQGGLLALLLAALLHFPGLRSPRARYGLCFLGLLAMVALPLATGWWVYAPAPMEIPQEIALAEAPPVALNSGENPPGVPAGMAGAPAVTGPVLTARDFTPAAPPRQDVRADTLRWERVRETLAPYVPWCVFAWLLGVFLMAWRNLASWLLVQRLRRHGVARVTAQVETAVETLCTRLGVRRAVACLESSQITVPATIGWLKPVILLPASSLLGLEAAQLEAILAHELAHIRRYDYLANLFQTLAETVLFFHPAVWWISRRMRLERELCCDDMAVQLCTSPAVYAGALARVEALRQAPAYAMAASGGSLLARIRRLARPHTPRQSRRPNALLSVAVIAGVCAAIVTPNISVLFAQESNEPPGARSINFPEWSMGQLMVRPWGSELDAEWQVHQPAMGAVHVPEGMEVQLVVDNNAVTDLSPLGYLAVDDLQSINFQRTEIQDDQLVHLEGMELRDLDFELTQITNEAIQYIDDMGSLERLSVGRTNVNNDGVSQLGGLTGLRYLDLNLTGVNDVGFAALENLSNLEYLDLWNAEITDESLHRIGTMVGLEVLGLEGTSITDEGIEALRQLVGLRELNLENTPLGDEGLRHLASLSGLTRLQLRNTRMSDVGAGYLTGFSGLQSVTLPNQLSPEALAALGELDIRSWHRGNTKFDIHVHDQGSGQPVTMAHIELKARTENGMRYRPHYFWTDGSGSVSFYYRESHVVDLTIHAEGYAPKTVSWELGQQQSIDVALGRAVRIGGYVVNERGEGVNGVSIALSLPGERDYTVDKMGQHTESSGEDGAWGCLHATADFSSLSVQLNHADYVETVYTPDQLSAARLRAGDERLVIRRGLEVDGSVVDGQGAPVSGASIAVMEQRRYDLFVATDDAVWSDEDGRFTLENQRPGSATVKVNAGGYLALVEEVEFSPDGPPLEFELAPGYLLHGKVVDHTDRPIAGVRIETPQYTGSPGVDHLSTAWRTVTGTDGRFQWDEAPEDAVSLRFSKTGYQMLQKSLVASSEEIVVVMGPPLVVSGTLTDLETGEAISGPVEVTFMAVSGERTMQSGRRELRTERGGYEVDFDQWFRGEEADFYQFVIHAPGYLPAESRRFQAHEGAVREDIALEPVVAVAGVVLDANENPVAGAKVYAVDTSQRMPFSNNEPMVYGRGDALKPAISNESGAFEVIPPVETWWFFAVAPEGYALLEDYSIDDEPPVLMLEPWARAELTVKRGDAPDAGADVLFHYSPERTDGRGPGQLRFNYQCVVGDQGRGNVQQLVAGRYALHKQAASLTDTTAFRIVEFEPGVAVSVQFGGSGRPVKGSVSVPAAVESETHWDNGMMVRLQTMPPEPPMPEGHEDWTALERDAWRGYWLKTEEGKAFTASQPPVLGFYTGLNEQRAFRLEDVPAGDYQLRIDFRGEPTQENQWNPPSLGVIERTVTVEEAGGDFPREAMDLGALEIAR